MDLQAELEDHGEEAIVADSLVKVQEIMSQHSFSWAVLDLNLGETSSIPIAEELSDAGTRICFVTGSDIPSDVLKRLDATLLTKPVDMQDLIALIKS